ncbi:flagellin [Rhizobium halophytocola]|uniref:Flagellin n=1 Tax=Rhizobium halophytocola TaxID=735519 RepID=A0ABS4E3T4_9HYPH|nr:flagellin [Rhizobium halophytocola]MBP1852576.1 flagellin [Rhizobium halophytocola]
MTSISFNSTAASALSLLTGSNKALQESQDRISSGLRVNQAADNAAYWSIATSMRADNLSLSSAEDATGLAAAVTDTAALGMEQATSIVSDIQSKLILAKAVGGDKTAINSEIDVLKDQLKTVAKSASFNGQNWLNLDKGQSPQVESMVASVSKSSEGQLSVNVIDFDTAGSTLVSAENADDGMLTRSYSGTTATGSAYEYYLLDPGATTPTSASAKPISLSASTTNDDIDGMIAATNAMMSSLTDAGAQIGATASRISQNTEFLADLQDVTAKGVGRLVDSNMEEEATRLSAAKVQQQLQTQMLNIANSGTRSSLSLFM